ncbi:SRSF protein kinase 1 [Capsicum annuum]|uniref:non-specific serine/threonine protein kinase n=1 Tax=Capsicum annuum TaxID=4072 RepID=A0A2G3A9S3_CAPAN|nr:SRSF protein kinase 1 [Capsicum annuum]
MSCSSSSSASEEEDEGFDSYRKGGYHAVRVGDSFSGGRYIAQRKLGWGEFSTVWLAYDTRSSGFVALKIQKSAPQFSQAALHEIEVLSAIANGDRSNSKYVVRLIDHFKHTGPNGQHLCMVLEFLGDSLLRLIKHNRYKGLELNKVREICKCVLTGLDYLHRGLGIIHTDLKLENILLLSTINATKDPIRSGTTPILERPEGNPNGGVTMNIIEKKLKQRARRAAARISGRRSSMGGVGGTPKPNRSLDGIDLRCKVVDFGNACWADKQFAQEIQTRQYRSPEVILQSGYSFSADMWSFACIAFELATGEMMFTPKGGEGFSEDEDHLAMMMELLGKIPRKIAGAGAKSKDYFDRYGDLKRIRRLKYGCLDKLLVDKYRFSESDAHEFAEFLGPLFDFEPDKRPTAEQCLQHPWLNLKNLKQTEVRCELDTEKVNVVFLIRFAPFISCVLVVLDDHDGEMPSEGEIDLTPNSWF